MDTTVSKILGPIHVSGWEGASDFDGDVIFLHHDIQWYSKGLHIPILRKRPNSDTDRTGAEVNFENLDFIVSHIEYHFATNRSLLVHCKGGVERSPLAVAAWLRNYRKIPLDDAYEYIKMKRSVVEDRRYWLNGY